MTESEKRSRRCCFTGHRPDKLSVSENEIKEKLKKEIRHTIADGIDVFITGMALGVDILAAEIVLEMREQEKLPIKLIAACPHPNFEHKWSVEWKRRYAEIMGKADYIKIVCPHYIRGCYQIRNQWMVDHSAKVIAVWNGTSGGTKNTVMYANRKGVSVVNILNG